MPLGIKLDKQEIRSMIKGILWPSLMGLDMSLEVKLRETFC
jgi:hypothetical protein